MKRGILLLFLILVALPATAFDTGNHKRTGVGVIVARGGSNPSRMVREALPGYLVDELRHRGIDARELRLSMPDLQAVPSERTTKYVVEISDTDAGGGPVASVGTGGVVGDTGVGGEVSVVVADVAAEVRIYDGETLELLDTFNVASRRTAPTLTSIGIGGRHAGLYLPLPYLARAPFRLATHDLAEQAATRIVHSRTDRRGAAE